MVAFRGTKQGLSIQLGDESDFDAVIERLAEKVRSNIRFFEGAQVTIDPGSRVLNGDQQEQIASLLGANGLTLVGIVPQARKSPEGEQMRRGPTPTALPEVGPGALVVTRTLRSGQNVRHNGDVIVLGDVNPGAEIVAAGHIVVMGALRGVAHAGATGNSESIVAAVRLRPTQLRIAQVIGRAPDQTEPEHPMPEVARVRDGMIVLESPV